jgi:hypothetical protein
MEGDPARRKQILWEAEHKLAEEDVRPIIFEAGAGGVLHHFSVSCRGRRSCAASRSTGEGGSSAASLPRGAAAGRRCRFREFCNGARLSHRSLEADSTTGNRNIGYHAA